MTAQAPEGRRIRGVPRALLPAPRAGYYWRSKGRLDHVETPIPATPARKG